MNNENGTEKMNKVALITGASSGIGYATAQLLADNGIKVGLFARREQRLKTLAENISKKGGKALILKGDVTKRKDVENAVKEIIKEWSHIDILVNNAGLMPLSFIKNLHIDEWDRMVDVNIKGVLYMSAAVLPYMLKQHSGHIINVSSVAGRRVFPAGAVYCATKYAVRAFSDGLRCELTAQEKIRVTTIEPGIVKTELPNTITDMEIKEPFAKRTAAMRPLQANDIAKSIFYAISQPDYADVAEILVIPTDQGT